MSCARLYGMPTGNYAPRLMEAPMVGSWSVEVKAVRPFTIHGDLYYELHVLRIDDPAGQSVLAIRVPRHAVHSEPRAGDRLNLTFLMGQVTAAKPMDGAG